MELLEGQPSLGYTPAEMEQVHLSTLEHIEKIIDYAEALGGITDILFEKAHSFISIVSERLSISPAQAVLFSLLFKNFESSVTTEELSKLLQCSLIKTLLYENDFEELSKRKLISITKNRYDTTSYKIAQQVITTLKKQDVFVPETHQNVSIDKLFDFLGELFEQVDNEGFSPTELQSELNTLIQDNMHLLFCQKLENCELDDDDKILLLCFCHLFVNNDDDNIGFHDLDDIYDSKSTFRHVMRDLRDGDHTLMEMQFIENTNANGFGDRESFKLTDKAKKELLSELDIKQQQGKSKKGLLVSGSLSEKKMFYNDKVASKIHELTSLLKQQNFKEVKQRLSENGMRNGFACLFYGAPGTGKTETVYQIARETGRDIMPVDISETKSMWFGESEKKIKEVFDRYKSAVEASEAADALAPILLFNEADAVIGKRLTIGSERSGPAQTENAIQNIILQEIENLTGILIATTNLTQNLDKAFERRFLYKIEFEKPDLTARKSIWQSIIPSLSDSDAGVLASRYDFSGGQIENIARKRTVDSIISGAEPGLDSLLSYCKDESLAKEEARVGFAV